MISDFFLVAIVRNRNRSTLFRIPIHQSLQDHMKDTWNSKYESFIGEYDEVDYMAGYRIKRHQCFRFLNFDLPMWLKQYNSRTAITVDEIGKDPEVYNLIQGTIAFTRNHHEDELMLFQDFSRSKVIGPGRFLHLDGDAFRIAELPGVLLDRHLSAVYSFKDRKILFRDFRGVNSFLPISDFYKKVSEREIRAILQHDRLATEDPDKWALGANHWFRTRFILLRSSGILDRYSAAEIKSRSIGYNVSITILNDRIVFPTDNDSARKLLQFLNEEILKGPITDTIYETNYNRKRSSNITQLP